MSPETLPQHVLDRIGTTRLPRGAWAQFAAGGMLPAGDALVPLCRLITPAFSPIRFDARFLLAPAERALGELRGNGELEFLRWIPLAEAETLDLALPQRAVLREVADWLAAEPEARAAARPALAREVCRESKLYGDQDDDTASVQIHICRHSSDIVQHFVKLVNLRVRHAEETSAERSWFGLTAARGSGNGGLRGAATRFAALGRRPQTHCSCRATSRSARRRFSAVQSRCRWAPLRARPR